MLGRRTERAALDRLLEAARLGQSAALVLRGEAGIGKTALLEYAVGRAEGCRVLRAVGVESEMELPFAGLHQLCAPLLTGLERLPPPQRQALATAFGVSSGARPDRFLVGLALLSLLSDAAEEQPLLCLIDDAHWLDQSSAQVLAFVARRLQAESIVLLFAERERVSSMSWRGCRSCGSTGCLTPTRANCSRSVISVPLDDRVRERLVAETRGNPLALLELPRGLSPPDLAGGFALAPRCRCRAASRRVSTSESSVCPRDASGCSWLPRPSRPAIRRCYGERPISSASLRKRWGRRKSRV